MTSIRRRPCPRQRSHRCQARAARRRHRRARAQRRRARPAAPPAAIGKIVGPLLQAFRVIFTRPTWERFLILVFAAILTTGARTVLNLLRTVDALAPGHPSSYHRVWSLRRWCLLRLGRALAGYVLQRWLPQGPVTVAVDDTVAEHKGKQVYGKGCHRDAVRSSHSFTAYRWGHKWVVLALLVAFPFARRPWALPVLAVLYRSEKWDQEHGRRHKTPADWARQLLRLLVRWFPDRQFVFVGDGGYGTHALAAFAQRYRSRLTLVSRFYADANLYAPPPVVTGKKPAGRPRVKGEKQAAPQEVVAQTKRKQRLTVAWYGGEQRRIAVVSGTGHWYKSGAGLVAVRWVYVQDRSGSHRDEYFFSTDLTLAPQAIVETYTRRWNIETTFQELRSYLKVEKTRGWTEKTVLRTAPCLVGLYTVIALWYAELPARWQHQQAVRYADKQSVTFSDAITAVRRWLWSEWVLINPQHQGAFAKIPRRLRQTLLNGLAPAA